MATAMERSEMDPKLWGQLPNDTEGLILSFLTTPVQSRFRTVCKRWDALIRSAEFRVLCIQHANPQGYILGRVTLKVHEGEHFSESVGWKLLDVDANRWYFIQQAGVDVISESRTLAMEGGLACAFYLNQPAGRNWDPLIVRVENPLANVSERLPDVPDDDYRTMRVLPAPEHIPSVMSLVVERGEDFERYKVFVMSSTLGRCWQSPDMAVYDSTTRVWRPSSAVVAPAQLARDLCHNFSKTVRCTVWFQGALFALLTRIGVNGIDDFCQIAVFRPDADAWHSSSFQFSRPTLLLSPQLVVSGGRLFLLSWVRVSRHNNRVSIIYEVFEILVENGTMRWVYLFEIPEAQMQEQFETEFDDPRNFGPYGIYFTESPEVTAFGFEKAIVLIARTSGVSKEIDLATQSLVVTRPFETSPCEHDVWYGQPMSIVPHNPMVSRLR